jgi:hypothetical protein
MLRNAISAFTRVFDALWLAAWCAANLGSILFNDEWVRLCGAAHRTMLRIAGGAAPRPGH